MKKSKSLEEELQEVITKHTARDLPYNSDEYPFQVLFLTDKKDNVKIIIRWPDDISKPQIVKTMGHMLNHISCGNWTRPMIAATEKFGSENGQEEVANEILQTWAGQVSGYGEKANVCVKPRFVFSLDRAKHV